MKKSVLLFLFLVFGGFHLFATEVLLYSGSFGETENLIDFFTVPANNTYRFVMTVNSFSRSDTNTYSSWVYLYINGGRVFTSNPFNINSSFPVVSEHSMTLSAGEVIQTKSSYRDEITGLSYTIEVYHTAVEPDTDGDGIPNSSDPDIDGDGILNGEDSDVDGDGVDNGSDPDVDGDGVDNGSDPDVDGDGVDNGSDSDVDGDGADNGSDSDIDGDGINNGSDTDMDGDGTDNDSDSDMDGDGIDNASDSDNDADGQDDSEGQDTDGDGIPDSQDNDIDGDGIPNDQDPDVDGDGIPNEQEGKVDTDDDVPAINELKEAVTNKLAEIKGDTALIVQSWAQFGQLWAEFIFNYIEPLRNLTSENNGLLVAVKDEVLEVNSNLTDINSLLLIVSTDIDLIKSDVSGIRSDVSDIKSDVSGIRSTLNQSLTVQEDILQVLQDMNNPDTPEMPVMPSDGDVGEMPSIQYALEIASDLEVPERQLQTYNKDFPEINNALRQRDGTLPFTFLVPLSQIDDRMQDRVINFSEGVVGDVCSLLRSIIAACLFYFTLLQWFKLIRRIAD